MGKMLIIAGAVLLVVGIVIVSIERAGMPLGRVPGDMSYQGKNVKVYFPLGTSILLSIILSLIFWLIGRGR